IPMPMVPVGPNTSRNWAGYAATGGGYTSVTGTWTVPQPNVMGGPGIGATWVGIGGVSSRDLIQAGTQDATSGGQAQFQAWIEMLPQASQQVPLGVAPGDSVAVSIEEQGAGSGAWHMSITNNTSGQTFQTSASYVQRVVRRMDRGSTIWARWHLAARQLQLGFVQQYFSYSEWQRR